MNRPCLRSGDESFGKWDEILRDILNGKLRIIQNAERAETDSQDDDNDEEVEILEETGRVYDTSERNGRYEPIRTDPEHDSLQLHTDGEIPQGEISKLNIRRSNRNIIELNRYGSVPYQGNFHM